MMLFNSTKKEDMEEARALLLRQLELRPQHPTPLYNIACAEARLGNLDSALQYLEKSIAAGFKNASHMEQDTDLESLRPLEQFKNIVTSLKLKNSEQKTEEPSRAACLRTRCDKKFKWHTIQQKVMELFESGRKEDLELARELLLKQWSINTKSPIPLYNLACVESLLGNLPESIGYLKKAVSSGYTNVSHMEKDPDLASIRHLDAYKSIVNTMKETEKSQQQPNPQCNDHIPSPSPSPTFSVPLHQLQNQLWDWCNIGLGYLSEQINRLFERGTKEDLEFARNLLTRQSSLNPANPIPFYNLACVESLLGEFMSALYYLEQAVKAGYSDVAHMEKDTDLDPLRHMEPFQTLMNVLKNKKPQGFTTQNSKPQQSEQALKQQQQPEPSPKKEPIAQEPPKPTAQESPKKEETKHIYDQQISVLESMGWVDKEKNISILEITGGDLNQAVILLLEQ